MAKPAIDRLKPRGRPDGSPILHQRWNNLLFMHWPIDAALLRPLIPDPLEIDTFQGKAWIGITPFHLEDLRPALLPAVPGLSEFNECNVRTYVVHNGVPGIWFFSLDASKLLPALAARIFFMLPYYKASIRFEEGEELFSHLLKRDGPPPASFKANWRIGRRLRAADPESLGFFLTERYCAYAVEGISVYSIRIYHHPWILDEAEAEVEQSSLIESLGLLEPVSEPICYFSRSMSVEVWAPERVKAGSRRAMRRTTR